MNPTSKVCTGCGELKDFADFHKGNGKFNLASECKVCKRQYALSRTEERKAYHSDYYRNRKIEFKDANLRRLYGISFEEFVGMLTDQASGCYICGHTPGDGEMSLSVDHDHSCCPGKTTCGKCIRGLLCSNCNHLLGQAEDSIETLRRAVEYLRKYGDPEPSRSGMVGRRRDYSEPSRTEDEAARVRGIQSDIDWMMR